LRSNNFRVKLTGADGAAITGAQVTVTFFMPAMPAMGMAAMRMRAHNSHFNATYNLKARIGVQLRASPP
jgi:YtkA-like